MVLLIHPVNFSPKTGHEGERVTIPRVTKQTRRLALMLAKFARYERQFLSHPHQPLTPPKAT